MAFFIIRPSFFNRAILRRLLANEISLISLGSNQILRLPHLRTDAARRFWSLSDTVKDKKEDDKDIIIVRERERVTWLKL